MSSSPSRRNSTVFSFGQDAHEPTTITPPSSPPPILDITPPVIKTRKPTFPALDKKKQKEREALKNAKRKREEDDDGGRDESEPLSEITNSSGRPATALQPVQPPTRAPAVPKLMTQSTLDFGQQNAPITCSSCQMSYTPSVAEDAKLHNMYHNRNKDGIDLDKPFIKSAMKWCYEVPGIQGSVVVVDRKISVPARKTVLKVLEVVNKELGSVEIPESELWGQKLLEEDGEDSRKVDCYKVFLHVLDGKCVAVCLAERISKAQKVKKATINESSKEVSGDKDGSLNKEDSALLTPTSSSAPLPHFPSSSADIQLEEDTSKVVVGVSRIWTSKSFRKKGIANNLLDCVTTQFVYGLDIDKDEVAFTQPTDMGAALASKWYGSESGWKVYREE